MVHSGVLFALFCTANWLDVERLNINEGANKWGGRLSPTPAYPLTFNHWLQLSDIIHGPRRFSLSWLYAVRWKPL